MNTKKRLLACLAATLAGVQSLNASPPSIANLDRSPVDLVLAQDEAWLATANQTSGTVSLVSTDDGRVLDEVVVGDHPAAIALHPDGKQLLVTAANSGKLVILNVESGKLTRTSEFHLGFEPHGIAIDSRGERAYVALTADAKVAVVDLAASAVTDHIEVGRWPRYLALSPDNTRLAVGTSGDRGVSVVDIASRELDFIEQFVGLNIGHLRISRDNEYAYFPWVIYRRNPITRGNIRLGWVLATRIARVRLGEQARREAMSLDPRGEAIADPHGLDFTSDEQRLVVSAAGSQELLVYRAHDLPFEDFGGTDHVPNELVRNPDRFSRIRLGGRPMGLRVASDDRMVYVANYLLNSVQVVDIKARQLVRSINLGGPSTPSLVRRGEAIFFDARRSLDQWYSCHTCHYEGETNSVVMDTLNDDSAFTFKTVLPLYNLEATSPWTWHGRQEDLHAAMRKSTTSTMQGAEPSDTDVEALLAYLANLKRPPNPFRSADGSLTVEAQRGRQVFERSGCINCHSGDHYTDGAMHDLGLGSARDKHEDFNTPSLLGVYRRVVLLHDGRAKSLEDLLSGPHNPSKVSGLPELTKEELADLVAYLKSM